MADAEMVTQDEGDLVIVTERVSEPVTDLVKGCVVGIPVTERVLVGDIV